ncbi:MAG: sigW 10 [Phycisphaerales bacterium]|nr:sigW 10 [Phycisphaerales bacterium]
MAGVARGDSAAMRELLRLHGDYLFGVARTLTNSPADAEDAVQETLAALMTAKFRGDASLRTFLVSIVVRQAALIRRRTRPSVRLADDEMSGGADPQSAVDAKLDLAGLLARLSPEHREVLVLREIEGRNYEEMAESLGVPRGTIESRLHRARETLRKLWQK